MQIQMDYYTEPGSGNPPNESGSKENSNFNKIPYTVFMLIPNDLYLFYLVYKGKEIINIKRKFQKCKKVKMKELI